MQPIVQRPKK